MIKRLISMLLVTVMLCTSFIIPVSATEEETQTTDSTTTSIENGDLTVTGTNSFGNLLSDKIQESSSEMTDSGSRISDIQIEGTTATVTYSALEDCTILVGIFDETTDQLLASGKSKVSKDVQTTVITIETDTMPEYFKIKAYMLNSDNSPIATEYNSPLYTKAIQDLKKKTIHDFGDSEVLQLGEEEDTNFAVFKKGTKIIEYKEGYNIPELIDSENGKYVFSNATEEMMALVSGDAFSCTYSESDMLLAVVDTIQINGTTVTITDKDAEMEDIFECVKIESRANLNDCNLDNSVAPDCVQIVNSGKSRSVDEDEVVQLPEKYFEISINAAHYENNSIPGLEVNGDIKISARLTLSSEIVSNVYMTLLYTYIKLGFKSVENFSLRTSGSGSIEVDLVKIPYPLPCGVVLTFTPVFIVEANVALSMDYKTELYFGFSYNSDTGFQNESYSTPTNSEGSVNGYLLVGFKLKFGAELFTDKLLELNVGITIGIRTSGAINVSENHLCTFCIGGSVDLCIIANGEISVFNGVFGGEVNSTLASIKLYDWYRSYDYNEYGLTTCPHIKTEQIVDIVTMSNGYTSPNQEIYLVSESGEPNLLKSNNNGIIRCSLEPGNYMLLKNTTQKFFQVNSDSMTVFFDFIYDKSKYSGQCGSECYWALYDDGSLIIYGEGKMYDYTTSNTPWYQMRKSIKSITIYDGITNISNYAFRDCNSVTSISIPDNVTSIGNDAFYNCISLKNITIPNSVTSIGNFAFYNCTSLKNITIPDSVTSIGDYAFWGCICLNDLTMGNGISHIGDYAFSQCTSLVNIDIPGSVTSIGVRAFYKCTNLLTVTLENGVSNTGKQTFENCTNLKKVSIPNSVTTIGERSFYWCTNLLEINIPNGVNIIENNAFYNCESLKYVTISDSVTSIDDYAFYSCKSLKNITIPDSVTSIGAHAFDTCESLLEVKIPDSVTNIGNSAFRRCINLLNVDLSDRLTSIDSYTFDYCENLLNISIPNNVTNIGYAAFRACTNLLNVDMPDRLTSISDRAFQDCNSLTSISIPDSVTSMGIETFQECESLVNVTLGNNLSSVGKNTFKGCTNLESINLPGSITEICDFAFYNCEKLTNIIIPNSVTSIGDSAFYRCESLTNITIPGSVVSIGDSAFSWCRGVTELTICNGVKSIGEYAFSGISNIKSITIPGSIAVVSYRAFYTAGSSQLTSLVIENGVTTIEDYAFSNHTLSSKLTIPNSVAYIGKHAFNGISLSNVILPDNVRYESNSFSNSSYSLISHNTTVTASIASETVVDNVPTVTTSNLIKTATETATAVTSETTITPITSEMSNLIPNAFYFVVVVKSDGVEDLFTADNLLYFSQATSDEEGKISLSYIPRESFDTPVVLTYQVNNIENADIEIKDMYYTGSEQTVDCIVTLNGKILKKDVDFTVSSDLPIKEVGGYLITFTGINDYYGSVTKCYALLDPYFYGDADMDGRITVKDSTFIQRYLVGLETKSDEMLLLSDTDGNGEVNILDATAIQNYLADNDVLSKYTGRCSVLLK